MSVSVSGHFSPQIPLRNASLWLFMSSPLCSEEFSMQVPPAQVCFDGIVVFPVGAVLEFLAGSLAAHGSADSAPGSAGSAHGDRLFWEPHCRAWLCLISQAGIAVPQGFVQS